MRFKLTLISLFFILISAFVSVSADSRFDDITFSKKDIFTTVISDTSGNDFTFSGVADASSIEKCKNVDKISSYSVYKGDKCIISVKLFEIKNSNDASLFDVNAPLNGYYSTRFTLSEEDNTEVFLTGLTPQNLKKVQDALLVATIENSQFKIEDIDFIDAEKANLSDKKDTLLCWAATTSNLLHYTGWSKKASADFKTSDDVFDLYVDNFTDNAGNTHYGFEWFINGTYCPQNRWAGWGQVKNFGTSGGFLKDYSSSVITKYVFEKHLQNYFPYDYHLFEEGYGFSVSVGWLNSVGTRYSGHVISGWGYICDKDYVYDNPNYFKAIIVSDSDNNRAGISDRRQAPNVLTVLNMSPYYLNGYQAWWLDGYGGVFEGYQLIRPYNDTVPFENSSKATKDKFNYPDIVATKVQITTDSYTDGTKLFKKYYKGDTLYLKKFFKNAGNVSFSGNLLPYIEVKNNKTGQKYLSIKSNVSATVSEYNWNRYFTNIHNVSSLPVGSYTVLYTLNDTKAVNEAYYYNNEFTYSFDVVEKPANFSSSSFKASIGEFKNGKAEVTFSYGNFENTFSGEGAYTRVYKSVDGGSWEEIEYEDSGVFRKKYTLPAEGYKVKFCYTFHLDKDTTPLTAFSPEYSLSYSDISIDATTENTSSPTAVNSENKKLNNNEKFEFYLRMTSVGTVEPVNCCVSLYAMQNDIKTTLYKQDNIIFSQYDADKIYTVTSWNESLFGKYDIFAEVTGDFGTKTVKLSTISFSEQYSFHVNISSNTNDAFDGNISFAEAVNYLKLYGTAQDKITFTPGLGVHSVPIIVIDRNITIDGCGATVSVSGKLFQVNAGGVLNLKNMQISNGTNDTGTINVSGGTLNFENVVINSCSATFGASIYSKGGIVKLKNCIFKNNSGYRGVLYAMDSSQIDMLNCIFSNNSSESIVYAKSSDITIVNSTFVNNKINNGSCINTEGDSNVNVFGSIITNNDTEPECMGAVKLYGCFVTSYSNSVYADSNTVNGTMFNAFVCDTLYKPKYKSVNITGGLYFDKYMMSPIILNGIIIKNDGNCISYSADGSQWIKTDIPSCFSDEQYKTDMFGKTHGKLFGVVSEYVDTPDVIEYSSGYLAVYSPIEKDVTYIEKHEDISGNILNVKVQETTLQTGTNYLQTKYSSSSGVHKYMFWDTIEGMKPYVKSY